MSRTDGGDRVSGGPRAVDAGRNAEVLAVVGLFDGPAELLRAASELREKGLGRLEAYTPYPIHGLAQALGQKRSPLGAMVLVMGLLGAFSALAFQWWTSVVDYPVVTGGKPLFSWQAFVPIMFEVTVLFTAFTAGLAMLLLLNRLPFFGHPMLRSRSMRAVTRDRFALAVEAGDTPLDAGACTSALVAAGASEAEVLESVRDEPFIFRFLPVAGLMGACLAAGIATYWGVKLFPVTPPMNAMDVQPRSVPYRADAFFADGRAMRTPAEGTVARGHIPEPKLTPEEAGSLLANPLPASREVFERGRILYGNHCLVCHGPLGDGKAELPPSYGAKPANLQSGTIRAYPDGRIYQVITSGLNSMPGYAQDLEPEERWAVVMYLRALQRSQNALDEDIP